MTHSASCSDLSASPSVCEMAAAPPEFVREWNIMRLTTPFPFAFDTWKSLTRSIYMISVVLRSYKLVGGAAEYGNRLP
eukprot:COSAG02_NODE_4470_length_5330_cov_25.203785_4_plen_78_part_00